MDIPSHESKPESELKKYLSIAAYLLFFLVFNLGLWFVINQTILTPSSGSEEPDTQPVQESNIPETQNSPPANNIDVTVKLHNTVPVLMYHEIGDNDGIYKELYVKPENSVNIYKVFMKQVSKP